MVWSLRWMLKLHSGETTVPLTNEAGKTKCPHAEEWSWTLPYTIYKL